MSAVDRARNARLAAAEKAWFSATPGGDLGPGTILSADRHRRYRVATSLLYRYNSNGSAPPT